MSIADEFSGLDMKNIVGGPLDATVKAQSEAAKATSEFIESIHFEQKASKLIYMKDGKPEEVDVPLLSVVPIPSLQVDEVNVNFDTEVKQTEIQERSFEHHSGSLSFGPFSVSIEKQPPEDL